MLDTLRISFELKNTYRVNSILYALKQIPLIRRLLPEKLYRVQGLKIFANVLSMGYELATVFVGKLLYLLLMVGVAGFFYTESIEAGRLLHIFSLLTLVGALTNTYLFDPSRDKYYAVTLLHMNARMYTLVNYGYSLAKTFLGFLILALIFVPIAGLPVWIALLIPFFVCGAKLISVALRLRAFEKTGSTFNENKQGFRNIVLIALLLAAAYVPPIWNLLIPQSVLVVLMLLTVLAGAAVVPRVLAFAHFPEMCHKMLAEYMSGLSAVKIAGQTQSRRAIAVDSRIESTKTGFEYLNELFIKRHRGILWRAAFYIALGAACLTLLMLIAFWRFPEFAKGANGVFLTCLPYFVFVMYLINRGTGFTTALFMNCDHSMLTYAVYKKPNMILRLFRIRLREIIKINLLPAAVIGAGMDLLLLASGGTDTAINYVLIPVSILCLSAFFSVHYLTIYYLLQPYNAGTEIKSGTYKLILAATYAASYVFIRIPLPTLAFSLACIAFCVLYSAVACLLVYRLAPKTFRIRA